MTSLEQLFLSLARLLPAEKSHDLVLKSLNYAYKANLLRFFSSNSASNNSFELQGMTFSNPVGLAAGLDKNGEYIDALGALGFGFIEVGTVTPKPQLGNDKPRLFRLASKRAIINRMGFNNKGVDALIPRLQARKYSGIVGVNIGKNAKTELAKSADDYNYCLNCVYNHADYIVINISSPNTVGLRDLQAKDYLNELLTSVLSEHRHLQKQNKSKKPLWIKVAPDLNDEQLTDMAALFNYHEVDGIIATNTSLDKTKVSMHRFGNEKGGLSGEPILSQANFVLEKLNNSLNPDILRVGVGGINGAQAALSKKLLGASLVQVYSGLIYQGSSLIHDINQAWAENS